MNTTPARLSAAFGGMSNPPPPPTKEATMPPIPGAIEGLRLSVEQLADCILRLKQRLACVSTGVSKVEESYGKDPDKPFQAGLLERISEINSRVSWLGGLVRDIDDQLGL